MRPLLRLLTFVALPAFAQDQKEYSVSPGILTAAFVNELHRGPKLFFIPIVKVKYGLAYFEAGHNYDGDGTFAFYAGRKINLSRSGEHSIIPQVGVIAVPGAGLSVQVYYTFINKLFVFNFENLYSKFLLNGNASFYYNWSSIFVRLNSKFYGGLSSQLYLGSEFSYNDNGLAISYVNNHYSLVLFDFNPYQHARHYIALGVVLTMNYKTRR